MALKQRSGSAPKKLDQYGVIKHPIDLELFY